jgi:chemotaxis protein methyltransferase CheR
MKDTDCTAFLQWCLPRLGMRWAGYRRVRRQVCKRIGRRLKELGLAGVSAYRRYLETHPAEWSHLDGFCRVSVSRFYRDKGVFAGLERDVLPALARQAAALGQAGLRCWCAGCASGEEAYTLRIVWDLAVQPIHPEARFEILGTDADATLLARAEAARYPRGCLKDLPVAWLEAAFGRDGDAYSLRPEFRRDVAFGQQDIRRVQPEGPFDLILCRNLAFTYFATAQQTAALRAIAARLAAGGYLVIGSHERLPAGAGDLVRVAPKLPLYRKAAPRA